MTEALERDSRQRFRAHARTWLAENVPDRWRQHRGSLSEVESDAIRREWDRQLHRGGFAGLSLPVELGGRGLGLAEEVIFGELAAREHAPDGLGRIGKILTAPTLIAHGTPAQRTTYLPRILAGEEVWCQGFSEPGSGSDLASVTTLARKVDGGYSVSGHKVWTSFARHADRCLMLARCDESSPRYRNLSMYLVDMHQPGITISDIRQISGATHFAEVHFDEVFVADADRLGQDGDGWRIAMTVLTNERGGVEAISRYVEVRADMDLLAECCGKSVEYERDLGTLDTRVELIRWQVAKAVELQADEQAYSRATAILKVLWSGSGRRSPPWAWP